MTEETLPKLIHVARIQPPKQSMQYLFLRKKDTHHFVWFTENEQGQEEESSVQASTIEEAIRLASKHWTHHFAWQSSFLRSICKLFYSTKRNSR